MKKLLFTLIIALLAATGAWAQTTFTAENLKYTVTDAEAKTVELTGYETAPEGALTIPATVTNEGTKYSVTSIGERAFYNCKAITAVTIPSSVTGIGDWAFRTCVALTSITIPASVTSIGDWAFRECEALTSITIPASVTSIGSSAFEYCNALIAINVDEANEAYCSDGGILFNKDKTKLIRYPIARPETAYTVPASVTEIDTSAFNACKKLVQITLPDGLTKIPFFGFGGCIALTEINIPESVTAIGESAFRSCSLKEITIPDGVTEIPYHAFGYCYALERVTLGKGITSLGREAFGKSRAIRELTVLAVNPPALYKNSFSEVFSSDIINIPVYVTKESLAAYKAADGWKEFTNLKAIGSEFTADNLKYEITDKAAKTVTLTGYVTKPEGALTIPATVTNEGTEYSVTSIGSGAFISCSSLTAVTISDGVTSIGKGAFKMCNGITSVTIPVSVTSIGESAFGNCQALTAVTIPDGVTQIGDYAFNRCSALTAINVAESNSDYCSDGGVLFNKDKTTLIQYPIGKPETSYIIPEGVTSVGGYAFAECKALTAVTIPVSVTSIGINAFFNCKALTAVTIPDGVTNIGSNAFYGCENAFTSVSIPDGVTEIASYTFAYCYSLKRVTIGKGVTRLGVYAFGFNYEYDEVTVNAVVPPALYENSFSKVFGRSKVVYVPAESLAAYRAADGWKEFTNLKAIGSEFTAGNLKYEITDKAAKTVTLTGYVTKPTGALTIPATVTNEGTEYSVTSIGKKAFYQCNGITEMTVAATVPPTVGTDAFYQVSKTIPVYVPAESLAAYRAADGWKEFTNLKAIGSEFTADNLKYEVTDFTAKTVTLTGYVTKPTDILDIPATVTYEGKSFNVTAIKESAFSNCSKITLLTIPNTVKTIGHHAFSFCSGILELTIPDSVTKIGNYAFSYCDGIKQLTIGNGVTDIEFDAFYRCDQLQQVTIGNNVATIGDEAFSSCKQLKQISIPESVTDIGAGAFGNCPALTAITVAEGNTAYCSDGGILFSKDKTTLVQYPAGKPETSYTIPAGVTAVQGGAFSGTALTSVTIPESVTVIGCNAFYLCTALTAATVPDGVTSIENGTFSYCSALTKVTLGNGVTNIGSSAFLGCTALSELTVAATEPPVVAANAFENVSRDITVNVPAESLDAYKAASVWSEFTNLQPWGQTTFTVDNLTYRVTDETAKTAQLTGYATAPAGALDIPDSVTHESITYSVKSIGNKALAGCTLLTEVTIPDGVTTMGNEAFSGCTALTKVTFGSSLTTMGNAIFSGCTALTEIAIPDAVTTIGTGTFSGCTKLTKVVLGNGVKSLGEKIFYGCTSLTQVTLGTNVTTIGNMAFSGCTALSQITLPESVISIGESTFSGCSALTEIILPNSVRLIGENAFSGCSALEKVTFGSSVRIIAGRAFSGCKALTEMTLLATVPPTVSENTFDGVSRTIPVYVPKGSLETYRTANVWKEFLLKEPPFVVDYLKYCVIDPEALTAEVIGYVDVPTGTLSIPATVTHDEKEYKVTVIGKEAVKGCRALTELTLPATLTAVGEMAFAECTALAEMTVLATVPPTVTENTFDSVSRTIPVYVPAASLAAYQEAEGWKEFTNLQAIGSTGLQTPSMPESISIQGGMLHNPQGLTISIYDLTGRLVYSGNATTVELPAGIYIVSCNSASRKAVF